jgi:hypothetical protein
MASKRTYEWLVHTCGDDRCNRIAFEAGQGKAVEVEDVKRNDGEPVNMWKMPRHESVTLFRRTATNGGYPFRIYVREVVTGGTENIARFWKFSKPKRKHTLKVPVVRKEAA